MRLKWTNYMYIWGININVQTLRETGVSLLVAKTQCQYSLKG